jgi:hypothetical protein
MPNVELEVDQLAEFIFLRNINNAKIELELCGLEDSKDLFCFCVDLLCKGLVLMYGVEKKVELSELTMEMFNNVKNKMRCAAIEPKLVILPNNANRVVGIEYGGDFPSKANNLPLTEYCIEIVSADHIYIISFDYARPV